jgi:hypothetical protein
MQATEAVLPTFALWHVVRPSGLLGPERITQALQIILTASALAETTHARRPLGPGLDEPPREEGDHRKPLGHPTSRRGRARVYPGSSPSLSG